MDDIFNDPWGDDKPRFVKSKPDLIPVKNEDEAEEVIYQPTKRGRKKSTKAKIGKYFELTDDVIQTLQMLANHYHLNMTSALSKIILSHQKIIEDNQRSHEIEKTKITNYEKNIESLVRQMAMMEEAFNNYKEMTDAKLNQLDQMKIGERLDRLEKDTRSIDTTQQQLIKDLQNDGANKIALSIVLPTMNEKWVRDKQTRRVFRKESD